jgi:hypothetical protein
VFIPAGVPHLPSHPVRPELAGIGAIPAARASLASVAKRSAPAISPTSLAAVSGPQPRSATSSGATRATRSAISVSSALMVWVSSLSATRVRTRRSRCDQQADVELDAGQRRRRQRLDPGRQRGTRDRHRVDVIGLPTLTARTSTGRHQPRRNAHNALTATEQEALQRARNVPAVLQGPDPLTIEPARPAQQRREPTRADLNGLVTQDLTARDIDHSQRVRALVGVRPEHDHDPRPHPFRPDAGRSADTAC